MMINHVKNPQCFVGWEEGSSLSFDGESAELGQACLVLQSNRRIPSSKDRKWTSPTYLLTSRISRHGFTSCP